MGVDYPHGFQMEIFLWKIYTMLLTFGLSKPTTNKMLSYF